MKKSQMNKHSAMFEPGEELIWKTVPILPFSIGGRCIDDETGCAKAMVSGLVFSEGCPRFSANAMTLLAIG